MPVKYQVIVFDEEGPYVFHECNTIYQAEEWHRIARAQLLGAKVSIEKLEWEEESDNAGTQS